jgi:hypothetical protein
MVRQELAEVSVPEVRRLLEIALPLAPRSPDLILVWSIWRRSKRQQARRSHYRHRLADNIQDSPEPSARPP